jgi:hypothetical protein
MSYKRGPKDYYEPGDWNARCSLCGGKFKGSELIKHWQGAWRCSECWEPRHPQDYVRAIPDKQTPPFTQPPLAVFRPVTPETLTAILSNNFTWNGSTATFAQAMWATPGDYTWGATTSTLADHGPINSAVGAYTWLGSTMTVGTAYATWNPSDKSSKIDLSNGNLKAAANATGNAGVRANLSKAAGKWYWEITIDSLLYGYTNKLYIGIATSSGTLTNFLGYDAYGYSYMSDITLSAHQVWHNNSPTNYGVVYQTNDVIGVALNLTDGVITYYVNGASQGPASSLDAGYYFPAVSISWSGGSPACGVTANFGESTFVYTPPAGFNYGVY